MTMLKTITSLLLAVVVVFAGPGLIWVEHYCLLCKDAGGMEYCAASVHACSGLTAISTNCSCCEESQPQNDVCCAEKACSGSCGHNCLSVEQISFDWEAVYHPISLLSASFILPYLPHLFSALSVPDVLISSKGGTTGGVSPPVSIYSTSRDYLSFIRVLLI